MNRKVLKFGGVCIADSKNIQKVIKIIQSNINPVVIVSAPGQRNNNDIKITDLLVECNQKIQQNENCSSIFSQIEERFFEILKAFKINDFRSELQKAKNTIIGKKELDYTLSRGEYFTAKILAKILHYKFIDSAHLIKFYDDGTLNTKHTNELIIKAIKQENGGVVIPGFYGALPDGTIQTFSRDGSDYSASIVASAIDAICSENWKDVNGFMSANPKIVPNTRHIPEITFEELRELSYHGSKILHPDTVLPLIKKDIPLHIKSIFLKNLKGTIIQKNISKENKYAIKAITGKTNCQLFKLHMVMENNETELIYNIFHYLKLYEYQLVQIIINVDEIFLLLKEQDKVNLEEYFMANLKNLSITPILFDKVSQITIVGKDIATSSQIEKEIVDTLHAKDIPLHYLSMSCSKNSISLCVDTKYYEQSIQLLNNALF